MREPRTFMTGLVVGESPRWHGGRLWFCNWGAQEVVAADLDGRSEVVTRNSAPAGYSIDWLPDGPLFMTGYELTRRERDGSLVRHVDLSRLSRHGWNEIVVDGRSNIYVNSLGFQFGKEEFRPGTIALVARDGSVRQVADDIHFPNGMVVTPDNATLIIAESFAGRLTAFDIGPDGGLSNRRIWADLGGPGAGDGICLDADGAIWSSVLRDGEAAAIRVREGGDILERIPLDRACFACMLGGTDRRTLFMMVATFPGIERMDEMFTSRTGQILIIPAPAPGAGWP